MSNHSYGLWGYYGRDGDGRELTVQATGIGAGGAAAVLAELADLGVGRAVRVARCTALAPELAAGDRVRAIAGLPTDGVSRALAARSPLPDADLDRALAAAAPGAQPATVAGCDLDPALAGPEARAEWIAAGATVADLQTAALFALGERLGVAVAAGLVVAGPPSRSGARRGRADGLAARARRPRRTGARPPCRARRRWPGLPRRSARATAARRARRRARRGDPRAPRGGRRASAGAARAVRRRSPKPC